MAALLVVTTLNRSTFQVDGLPVRIRPDQVVVVLAIAGLIVLARRRPLLLRRTPLDLPIVGFLAANALASAVASPAPGRSFRGVLLLTVYAAEYFVVAAVGAVPLRAVPRLSALFVAVGVAEGAYALAAYVSFANGVSIGGMRFGQVGPTSVTARGTFWEPNYLGMYGALVGLFLVSALLRARHGRGRLALFFGFCLVGIVLVLTCTRSAWLVFPPAILAACAVRVAERDPLRQRLAGVALVALALALVAAVAGLWLNPLMSGLWGQEDVLGTRFRSIFLLGDSAVVGRFEEYSQGFLGWLERPLLGHGTLAHGYWLASLIEALYDTGVVGAAFVTWMWGAAIVIPCREFRRAQDPAWRASLFAAAGGNAMLALTSQASSPVWLGFSWVFVGLTMLLVRASRAEAGRWPT